MIGRVYCQECKETSLDVGAKRCSWCDTELTPVVVKERKRRRHSKWTDLKVNQCWEAYLKGHSVNQIAAVIWESAGFNSQKACSTSLHREFNLAGFRLRSQSQVTIERNLKHGKATRASRLTGGSENAEYRRWFKRENGRYNPDCSRDGCKRHAMDGDTFCYSHSPERAAERDRLCAAMRENSTQVFVPGEGHALAKLTDAQAQEIIERTGENRNQLAAEFNVTYDTIRNIQIGVSWTHLERAAA